MKITDDAGWCDKLEGESFPPDNGLIKISLTSSVNTGKKIAQMAGSSNLRRVTLELGGKSPSIRFESLDASFGDPNKDTTIIGRRVDKTQFERVLSYVESGKTEATLVTTGGATLVDKASTIPNNLEISTRIRIYASNKSLSSTALGSRLQTMNQGIHFSGKLMPRS
ncbi:aldehyde dehydrogenase family protein [Bipolaris maydis]|nr:aldehyde dehydrogenase family protein [Bipolaris maydis]